MPIYTDQLTDAQTNQVIFRLTAFDNGASFSDINRLNQFSIFLLNKGKGKLVRDTTGFEFSDNCLICFSLYQPFSIMPENEFEGILINFHPSFFCLFKHRSEVSCNGILFNNLYDTPVVKLDQSDAASLAAITAEMHREMQRAPSPDSDIILSYLKVFLMNASRTKREQQDNASQQLQRENPLAGQLQVAINEHFKTLHSPADYAALLFVSTQALNGIAKRYFNKTLISLIAERLVTEAKRELYLTAKPVKQIAFELGYKDEFYFSRFFKKEAGISPAIFREKVGFNRLQEAE